MKYVYVCFFYMWMIHLPRKMEGVGANVSYTILHLPRTMHYIRPIFFVLDNGAVIQKKG